jgi:inner membrane protein
MASFGHVAFGLLASRIHGGNRGPKRRHCSRWVMVAFTALALLPDVDLVVCSLMGVPDRGTIGHRGASHSLTMALAAGFVCALVAYRFRWPVLRTALVGTFTVASHALLDVLGEGGRGLPLFWPFSDVRVHSPWRIFPDSPKGLELLTRPGVMELAIELLLFLPITIYALWPRLADALARWRGRPQSPPQLTVLEGGAVTPASPSAPPLASLELVDSGPLPANDHQGDPPLRSGGAGGGSG